MCSEKIHNFAGQTPKFNLTTCVASTIVEGDAAITRCLLDRARNTLRRVLALRPRPLVVEVHVDSFYVLHLLGLKLVSDTRYAT